MSRFRVDIRPLRELNFSLEIRAAGSKVGPKLSSFAEKLSCCFGRQAALLGGSFHYLVSNPGDQFSLHSEGYLINGANEFSG